MKYIAIIIVSLLFVTQMNAQAPSMLAPNATQEFVFKLDKANGYIHLFKGGDINNVNTKYEITTMEIEIFDATGEYTGTLELASYNLPKEEVEVYEHLKIAVVKMKDTATGEEIILNNVAIADYAK